LLVKVKGPNQTTAYIETAPEYPVLVSGTIWGGLVRKNVIDPYYLVAALSCPYAVMARTRLRTNLNVEFLGADDLLSLSLPTPDGLAQRYIGDKVREAERLRERARRLEGEFRSAVSVTVPPPTREKTSRVESTELGRNLNPGAYAPDRRAVRAAVRAAGGRVLDTLADVESPTTDSYLSSAPYLGLDAIDSATCGLKPSTASTEAVVGTARLLREGPALSRLRPYLNKVTYIPPALVGGIGSTELLLVCPKAGVDGWFLYGVLKLETSVRQLNPVATGSTHPRVDREDVLDLVVPWRDDHETLGAKLRTAQACYFASAALTSVATTLVEQLIDGRLAEADLVAAQRALEGGDRSGDREILKALQQGDAVDAVPLITDPDALYALLDAQESGA
jgi:type I restriction enzyme S subunit